MTFYKAITFFSYTLVIILSSSLPSYGSEILTIRHIAPVGNLQTDPRNQYFLDLLSMALEKTANIEGPFQLKMVNHKMYQGRALRSLNNGILDIVWTMTSTEREQQALAIYIPLLKGLQGYRIFIIRQQDEKTFSRINTVEDLQHFIAGQGHDWPDSYILKANGLPVVSVAGYDSLFTMLRKNRFDYFPRGVNEAWDEIDKRPNQGLVVEKTLVLQYKAPIYFFVSKNNQALASRIERGLRLAIKSGNFDRLFYNHPSTQAIFKRAQLNKRKVLKLDNPLLPITSPLADKSLWYQIQ